MPFQRASKCKSVLTLGLIIWPNLDILLADRKADQAKKSGRFGKCLAIVRDFRPFFQIGFLWLMFCFLDRLELPEKFGL